MSADLQAGRPPKLDLVKLCAKAIVDIPHEKGCHVFLIGPQFCTCKLRDERIVQGLAAVFRMVAARRDRLRHESTDSLWRMLVARFRHAAAADVKIRITLSRSGEDT